MYILGVRSLRYKEEYIAAAKIFQKIEDHDSVRQMYQYAEKKFKKEGNQNEVRHVRELILKF